MYLAAYFHPIQDKKNRVPIFGILDETRRGGHFLGRLKDQHNPRFWEDGHQGLFQHLARAFQACHAGIMQHDFLFAPVVQKIREALVAQKNFPTDGMLMRKNDNLMRSRGSNHFYLP